MAAAERSEEDDPSSSETESESSIENVCAYKLQPSEKTEVTRFSAKTWAPFHKEFFQRQNGFWASKWVFSDKNLVNGFQRQDLRFINIDAVKFWNNYNFSADNLAHILSQLANCFSFTETITIW